MLYARTAGIEKYLTYGIEESDKKSYFHVDDNFLRMAQIIHFFPNSVEYVGSEQIVFALIRPIPRALWPGKPTDPGFTMTELLGWQGRVALYFHCWRILRKLGTNCRIIRWSVFGQPCQILECCRCDGRQQRKSAICARHYGSFLRCALHARLGHYELHRRGLDFHFGKHASQKGQHPLRAPPAVSRLYQNCHADCFSDKSCAIEI